MTDALARTTGGRGPADVAVVVARAAPHVRPPRGAPRHRLRPSGAASSSRCSAGAARARARSCGPWPGSIRGATGELYVPAAPLGRLPGAAPAAVGQGARQRRPRARRAGRRGRRSRTPLRRGRPDRPRGGLAQDAVGRRGPAGRAGAGARPRARASCSSTSPSARSTRSTRIRMHAFVVKLCQRHHPAVLLVTHDVDEAILLADRVLVLTDGRLSLDVPVDSRAVRGCAASRRSPFCGARRSPSSASYRRASASPTRIRSPCTPPIHRTGDTQMTTTLPPPTSMSARSPAPSAPRSAASTCATSTTTTIAAIRQVWLDRKVVFFPGQHLDEARAPGVRRPLRRAHRGPPGRPGRRRLPEHLRDRLLEGPRALRPTATSPRRAGASTGTPTSRSSSVRRPARSSGRS